MVILVTITLNTFLGKPSRALETLYDVIKSRKRNNTYSEKLIEQIMCKYLELCVDLRKSHVAKEGLYQYRNLCQSTNVASLADVVQGYLNLAEKRTDEARQKSHDSVQEVDDLENLATPEMIMLSAVSVEGAQERSDRTILMPWVKFLWESYCQCLELLRTNSRVERLYHDIAQQAFHFCLKYQRKTEFRKLCDKLRNHMDLIFKQPQSSGSINLSSPETQEMNLNTRLVQLDSAIQMELWQEAYKAVEDIHGLMTMSKKVFSPKMMANYYQKLALVFWKSGNLLFHAAAIFKHFQLIRDMKKNISAEELSKMASRVLIAILAVPIPSQHPEFETFIETDRTPQEKMARLAVLLSLQQAPTRQSLLKDASRFSVVQTAMPQIRDLYQWLEVDFHPLRLCQRIQTAVKFVEECDDKLALVQYIPPLKDMTLVRLLNQVSQVYQSICFSRLLELAPFADAFTLERVIVDCVRHNDMQIRMDHRTRTVHFGTELAEAQSYTMAEGPHLQDMPSEQIRTQLMKMYEVLNKSLRTINPDKSKEENNAIRMKIVEAYNNSKQRDHQKILNRQKIIEALKEDLEKMNIERDVMEQKKIDQQLREQQKLEEERLLAEKEQRQQRKEQEMLQQIKQNHLTEKIQQFKQTDIGQKILKQMDEKEIAELDTDQIMARQVEELEKEKRELANRLKNQEKKVDHLERAKRLVEIPLLEKAFEDDIEQDKVYWKAQEKERIANAIKEREEAVLAKKRLGRMAQDKDTYLQNLLRERKAAFDKKLSDFNKRVEQERVKRLADRKRQRKEDRRNQWIKRKEEEAQRKKDEAMKRKREEEARLETERRMKEEEEYRKRKEHMDAIEEKKRQREKEIEEKLQAERQAALARAPPARANPREESDWRAKDNPPRDERAPPFRGGRGDDRPPREDRQLDRRDLRDDRQLDRRDLRDDRQLDRRDLRDDRRDDRHPDRRDMRDREERPFDRRDMRDDRRPMDRAGGPSSGPWRAPGGGSSKWKEREMQKDEEWTKKSDANDRREPAGGSWRDAGPRDDRRDDRRGDRGPRDDRRDRGSLRGDDRRDDIRDRGGDIRRGDRGLPGRGPRDGDMRGGARGGFRKADDASDWRSGGPDRASDRPRGDARGPSRVEAGDDRRDIRRKDPPPREERREDRGGGEDGWVKVTGAKR